MKYSIQTGFKFYIFAVLSLAVNWTTANQVFELIHETKSNAWNGVIDGRNQLWVAIYPEQQHLILVNPEKKETLLSDKKLNSSGLALASAGTEQIWIAYRSKTPTPGIFVVRSDAPQTRYQVSDNSSSTFTRILLESDHNGGVYVLWYGEQLPNKPSIQKNWLWLNHVNHDGKIATPEPVVPGAYPLWIHNINGKIAIFTWYKSYIRMRLRDTSGTFSPETTIAKVRYISPPLGTFKAGNRWFVYWIAQYGILKDDFLIEGAYSDNEGKNWQPFNLESLRKLDIRNIGVATDTSNHIALIITGLYRNPQIGQRSKLSTYLITSNDNGNSWNAPLILSPDTAHYSQAPNAKVAFVGESKSQLLLLVEDWRTIRSSIRYWISEDNGATWKVQDRILALDPKFNYQLSYSDKSIYNYKNQVTILAERLGDELAHRTIFSITTPIQELINAIPIDSKPNIEQLKARVTLYGKALIEKNYQAAYDLFDPFYRARVDFLGHLQYQGRITYTTAEFKDAQIQGNLAIVQLHIVASVPPFKSATGEIMQVPAKSMNIPMNWLWIDGEWYKEFYSEARELRYTRY